MNRTEKDLSYFRLRLEELLYTSVPELCEDAEFIHARSEHAAYVYQEAFRCGNSVDKSSKIAEQILFEGLYFSKFDTVFQVVCREFDTIMDDEELRAFALKMFPICEDVFEGYSLTSDFQDSATYELLYTEITGTIQIWIEDHGLQ